MLYKVGEYVIVREDLSTDPRYYMLYENGERNRNRSNVATREMLQLRGCKVKIVEADNQYIIEDCECYWTDEMFIGLIGGGVE